MRAIRHILVAVKDPRAKSLPAVDKAAQIAKGCGARLELFHGLTDKLYVDVITLGSQSLTTFERNLRDDCLRGLEAIAAPLRKRGLKVTTAAEWDFPASDAVVRRAARVKADLIVAEAHAGAHQAPWLLRFSDWELLRVSPLPVLLVKSSRPYRRPKLLAAIDPSHSFSKPARLDDEILRISSGLVGALRGSVHAVHAYLPLPVGLSAEELIVPNAAAQIEKKASTHARSAFDRALRFTRIAKNRRHLIAGHPLDAIPLVADQIGGSIVVMGAISRSGLRRIFIGNTAERLLDRLTCDVLVVKPRRFAKRVATARRGPRLATATAFLPQGF